MKNMKIEKEKKMFLIDQRKRPVALNANPSSFTKYGSSKILKNLIKIPIFNQNGDKMVMFGGLS